MQKYSAWHIRWHPYKRIWYIRENLVMSDTAQPRTCTAFIADDILDIGSTRAPLSVWNINELPYLFVEDVNVQIIPRNYVSNDFWERGVVITLDLF